MQIYSGKDMSEQDFSMMIRSTPCPACSLCGSPGTDLYRNLQDRLFSAWGTWNLKKCSNPQCGIVWLDPMPSEQDIGKAYQAYYTHTDTPAPAPRKGGIMQYLMSSIKNSYLARTYGYNKMTLNFFQRSLWPLAYLSLNGRVWLDSKVMYLRAPYKGRLLEIGAGSGEQLEELIAFGWDGEGIDNDRNAVENALKKRLRVRCGTVEAQRYPDNSFDVIIMNHVIEHVHDPHSLFSECFRILRPAGRLVIVTPNILSLGHRLFKDAWFPLDPPRHLRVYTPSSLRSLLGKAGFGIETARTSARNANGIFWTSRSIKQSGRGTMSAVPGTPLRTAAWFMLFLELLLMKFDPNLGEEITIVARK